MIVRPRPLWALALLGLVLVALGMTAPARAATLVLYDGSVPNQTPADQGYLSYQSYPEPPAAAAELYAAGGTTLQTSGAIGDYAGYYNPPDTLPSLSRTAGFTLTFTAQVLAETHIADDRAGFTVTALADDRYGIELAFWGDEIWAQNDGANDPTPGAALFSHGEGVRFDTTADPVAYELAIRGGGYTLRADGVELLGGPLRRYTPPIEPGLNPLRLIYFFGRLVFLGDNTNKAGADVHLSAIALTSTAPPPGPAPSPSPEPSPSPSPSPEPSPSPSPSPTTRLQPRAYLPAVGR